MIFFVCLGIFSSLTPAQTKRPKLTHNTLRYPTSTIVEVKLSDTVSPDFLQYHFKRFGFNVLDYDLRQVEAIISDRIPNDLLLRISEHPFIEVISVEEFHPSSSPSTRIIFNHYVTDEMIDDFLRLHSGLDIELIPRAEKKVILKMSSWRSDIIAESLELIIYVEKATILSPYINQP